MVLKFSSANERAMRRHRYSDIRSDRSSFLRSANFTIVLEERQRTIMPQTLTEPRSPQPPVIADLQAASAELVDRVLRHPFLVGCAEGSITLDQLRAFLVQHGKYSRYFTR